MKTYDHNKLKKLEERRASLNGSANGLSENYRSIAVRRMEVDKEFREASACPYRSRDKALLAELGKKIQKFLREENAIAEQVGTARQHADHLNKLISRLKSHIQKTGAQPRG